MISYMTIRKEQFTLIISEKVTNLSFEYVLLTDGHDHLYMRVMTYLGFMSQYRLRRLVEGLLHDLGITYQYEEYFRQVIVIGAFKVSTEVLFYYQCCVASAEFRIDFIQNETGMILKDSHA
jgi:hypothetical protein